jgi:hypothetical protein
VTSPADPKPKQGDAAGQADVKGFGEGRPLEGPPPPSRRQMMVIFVYLVTLIGIGLLTSAFFINVIVVDSPTKPALLLPLLMTIGVILLIATLGAYAVVLAWLGLSPKEPRETQALGLPEGSIRAVLALSLVLVFAILSVFLFNQLQSPPQLVSQGLTAEQVALLPPGQVLRISPDPSSSPQTFTVDVTPSSTAANQVAQQLVTVLATLVTAVAAFYFGASTVKEAHAAAAQAGGTGANTRKQDGTNPNPAGPAPADEGRAASTKPS